jgi:hypothetical protein
MSGYDVLPRVSIRVTNCTFSPNVLNAERAVFQTLAEQGCAVNVSVAGRIGGRDPHQVAGQFDQVVTLVINSSAQRIEIKIRHVCSASWLAV